MATENQIRMALSRNLLGTRNPEDPERCELHAYQDLKRLGKECREATGETVERCLLQRAAKVYLFGSGEACLGEDHSHRAGISYQKGKVRRISGNVDTRASL